MVNHKFPSARNENLRVCYYPFTAHKLPPACLAAVALLASTIPVFGELIGLAMRTNHYIHYMSRVAIARSIKAFPAAVAESAIAKNWVSSLLFIE